MSDELIRADTAALMAVIAMMMVAIDTLHPGMKQAMAETIEGAIKDLPDQESSRSMKATLQTFHKMMTRDNPLDSLLH